MDKKRTPLLTCTREELEKLATELGLEDFEDLDYRELMHLVLNKQQEILKSRLGDQYPWPDDDSVSILRLIADEPDSDIHEIAPHVFSSSERGGITDLPQ